MRDQECSTPNSLLGVKVSPDPDGPGPLLRFGRALGFGLVAATFCSLAWFGVAAFSSYELFLLSVAVGMVIGMSVNHGSYGKGGWGYQFLAMSLTYLSIVSAYVPVVVDGLKQPNTVESSSAAAPTAASAASRQKPRGAAAQVEEPISTLTAVLVAVPLAVVAPFLLAISDLGSFFVAMLVLGLAVYQAWKTNRRFAV